MAHEAGKDQMGRSILKWGAIAVIVLLIVGGIGAALSGGDDGEQTRSTPTAQPTRSTPTTTTPTRSSTPSPSVQTVTASGTGTDVKIVRFGAGQYRCTFSVSDNWDTSFGSRIADNFIVTLETDGDWLGLRVNEIESDGRWTVLVDAGDGGSYPLEVEAYSSATWSMRCTSV